MLEIVQDSISLPAPCKVNLTLNVFAPRTDGFHDLDSVVTTFALPADEVKVTLRPGARTIRLISKSTDVPKGAENLAHRAAQAFVDRFLPDENLAVYIKLEKRLPVQAGLGGGSSDAAAVLRALDTLIPGTASTNALAEVAASLGSDVPLFLSSGPVRMRGRGEIIEQLDVALPPLWGVIVKPQVGVPTGPAYALLDALPNRVPGMATAPFIKALGDASSDIDRLGDLLANDFEAAVLPGYPDVAEAHLAVQKAGAVRALLCGSGSAIFGLARSRDHARELVRVLAGRFPWVKMAQPVTQEVALHG